MLYNKKLKRIAKMDLCFAFAKCRGISFEFEKCHYIICMALYNVQLSHIGHVKLVLAAIIPQPLFFSLLKPQNDYINAEPISSKSKETPHPM